MSKNPRMTKQDIGLAAGAMRRAFSRSELRRQVVDATVVPGHVDASRPRVKNWSRCTQCKKLVAKSEIEVDHNREPVIPLDSSLVDVVCSIAGWDLLVDRIWCDKLNLQGICGTCHNEKSKAENKIRRRNKKGKK